LALKPLIGYFHIVRHRGWWYVSVRKSNFGGWAVMRLKVAILSFVLALGVVAATGAVFFPNTVTAGPKNPDCNGC
jgi:hypothetical protein